MNAKDSPEHLLKFGMGKEAPQMQAHLLVENAKACYIMARPILNTQGVVFYYPASFFVMHHSLESFIKAFLLKENIHFEVGQKGHKLVYLIELGCNNKNLEFFQEILQDQMIKDLLNSLDGSYNSNKYWEVGFNAKIPHIVDIFDELISIFTERFHQLYGDKRKEASIDVPEELANLIERNRKYTTTLCILPKYNN